MNNRLMVGLVIGCALLIGFAAGRLTSSSEPAIKVAGDKASGKAKVATTKRTPYKMPNAGAMTSANAPEAAPDESTNRFGRGRGGFDPAAYATMMKERAVTERKAFITNAGLTPAQQQDFDDLVTAMNGSLKQRAEKFSAMVKEGKPPSPEASYHMLHEYASSMMRAYEMMDRTMPAGWREKAGESFNMRNFVDPSIREATRGFSRGGPSGGPGGDRGPGGRPPSP
ncbi:MAG: hypothetical protein NTY53_13430 [Kiritimatiellaeota bacterium]|nr:hypothetical protein [Kiritimatiellota bacterium]